MKFSVSIVASLLLFFVFFNTKGEELKLWYKLPAASWDEALPIGNGRLGAMVFGGVENERLQLNEETVWSKGGVHQNKKDGYKAIPEIRELLFKGNYVEAEEMCEKYLLSDRMPSGTNTYQTLGDINISFEGINGYSNYQRELNLDSAYAKTTFVTGKVLHTRTVFTSHPDQVIVMLAEADQPGQISCLIELSRPGDFEKINVQDGMIVMTGQANNNGVKFETRIKVNLDGGQMKVEGQKLHVKGADKLELRVVAGSDYRGDSPYDLCSMRIKG